MKVAHIMAPGPVGGAEQVVTDLVQLLTAHDCSVDLVTILDEHARHHPFLELERDGLTVHPLRVPSRGYLTERRRLRTLLAQIAPEVVHTHGYRADVLSGSVARKLRIPTTATAHGFTGGGVKNRLYEYLQRRALRRCTAVVAVSVPMARDLEAWGIPAASIRVIPNARTAPVDALPAHEARRRFDVGPEPFHVGWVGRLSQEKGPDVMLDAVALLKASGAIPNLRVSVVGDGSELALLRSQCEAGPVADTIRWWGRVPNAASLFSAFDVMVLSSRTEGTPIVALESMLAGIPLVATRVGGVPDLVREEEGWLVPPEDPEALAREVQMVHDQPKEARARATRALERVRVSADPEEWAHRYLELYREISTCR